MISRTRSSVAGLALVLLVLGGLSCEQYEYNSPLPGIVEIRLAVKNSRTEILNFTSSDSTGGVTVSYFGLTVKTLEVFRTDGARQPIYASLYAIRRSATGDVYNSLAAASRDSVTLLGVGYVPPGNYSRVELTIRPEAQLVRSFGNYTTTILVVDQPPFQALQRMPDLGESLNIPVEEGKTTRVVITFDMDRSLMQRDENFDHMPHYFVSSVRVL